MSQPKEIKAGGVYTILGVAQTSVWVLLIPIHTKFLSPEDYGLIAICTAAVAGLATFLEFGLSRAASRTRYANLQTDITVQDELATPVRFLLVVAVVLLGAAFLLERFGFFVWLSLPFPLGLLTVAAAVALPVTRVYGEVLKMEAKYKNYSRLMILMLSINLIGNIFLVGLLQVGPEGVLWSIAMANWAGAVVVFCAIKERFSEPFDYAGLNSALAYGLPLIPHFSIGAFLPLLERSLLTYFIGAHATGIYAVAASISNIMTIITTSVTTAFRPRVFKLLENESGNDSERYLKNITLLTTWGFICFALMGALLAEPIISLLVGEQFYYSWLLVPVLLMRHAIYGAFQVVASAFYYVKGGTRKLIWVSSFALVILLAGSIVFIPKFGVYGLAAVSVAVALSYLLYAIVLARRLHSMCWPIMKLIGLLCAGAVFVAGGYLPSSIKLVEMVVVLLMMYLTYSALRKTLNKEGRQPVSL